MVAVKKAEVERGLVVTLCPLTLVQCGQCFVNQRKPENCARDCRPFIIASIDQERRLATLCPLYTRGRYNHHRFELRPDLKQGPGDWLSSSSYCSRVERWEVPITSISRASFCDHTTPGRRRYYALGEPGELDAIQDDARSTRCGFRPLTLPRGSFSHPIMGPERELHNSSACHGD